MSSPHVTDVTDTTFEAEVLQSDLPVLIDFWATWCAPCKAIAPHLETLAAETNGTIKVVKVDAQKNMGTASRFRVTGLPTFIVIQNGTEVRRKTSASGGLPALRKLVEGL